MAPLIPAPQSGEQTEIPAGAQAVDFGQIDASNALAISCANYGEVLVTLTETGNNKTIKLWMRPGFDVVVPWDNVLVSIENDGDTPAYAWILTLEKTEAPITGR